MLLIQKGTQLDGATPLLEFWAARDGKLEDLYALSFQVWNLDDNVQVTPGLGSTTVDVAVTYPTAGAGRLSKGRYFATWVMPGTTKPGRHQIRWTYQFASTDTPMQARVPFEIVSEYVAEPHLLCGLLDFQAEGVGPQNRGRELGAIRSATRTIERLTGDRFFDPRARVLTLDGTGSPWLPLPMTIIAIESVTISSFGDTFDDVIDPSEYRVFARHVSEGMVPPTDRDVPKIELGPWGESSQWQPVDGWGSSSGRRFPEGRRNVQVKGVFGLTEYDGTPWGRTPEQLVEVCKTLAFKELPKKGSADATSATAGAPAGPLVRLKQRDQEVEWAAPGAGSVRSGMLTGDADVDDVILSFRRPSFMSAV